MMHHAVGRSFSIRINGWVFVDSHPRVFIFHRRRAKTPREIMTRESWAYFHDGRLAGLPGLGNRIGERAGFIYRSKRQNDSKLMKNDKELLINNNYRFKRATIRCANR